MATAKRTSSKDYTGRQVDLLLLSFIDGPGPETTVSPQVVPSPRRVSGIEKMAQRFALLFLTQTGSVGNCPNEGTDLLGKMGSGQIYDDTTLKTAAAAANKATFRQMRASDSSSGLPKDEILYSSEITDVSTDRNTASAIITIRLTSESGDSFTYTTPIPIGL